MLVCYLDGSGNDEEEIITIAGYLSTAENWLMFEEDARGIFDAIGLEYLHAVDIHQGKNFFKGKSREYRTDFSRNFYRLINAYACRGVAFSVYKQQFYNNKKVYDVPREGSPYGFAFKALLTKLVRHEVVGPLLNEPEITLSFVLEDGDENNPDIVSHFDRAKSLDPERLGSLAIEGKKERIALQAADFLAYYVRRLVNKDRQHKRFNDELALFRELTSVIPHDEVGFVATDFFPD